MLALLFLMWLVTNVIASSGGLIRGSPITCDEEGMNVNIPWISNDPCITCKCQNKEVVCHKEICPNVKSCYFLLFGQEKKSCCEICKVRPEKNIYRVATEAPGGHMYQELAGKVDEIQSGCTYKGQSFVNGEKWKDIQDPCKYLICQGGIVTETNIQCYTPCRTPLPPDPGSCCPTCPGCKSDANAEVDEVQFPMPQTDPCVMCKCLNDNMVCRKEACPVLPCPPSKYRHRPGVCCPECVGIRRVYRVDGRCLLGMQIFKAGDELQYDACTRCQCNESTSQCVRDSCPPLDCWPEHQVKEEQECCPRCREPEERKAVCMANGKMFQDGDRWKMEKCTHCVCNDGQVHCAVDSCETPTSCEPRHSLKTQRGSCCPTCVEDDGVCTVFGDPHYKNFDGRIFNFQGSCKYALAKDCRGKSFSVEVLNDSRYSKVFSWTKSVTIKVNGTKVRLAQYLKVHVNHKPVKLPYVQLGVLSVFQEGFTVLVRTNIGVKVMWDGNSFLEVSAPSQYKNQLCGLCGNYNGNPEDDFRTKRGKLVLNAEEFANSWRVGRMKRCALSSPSESVCHKNWDIRVRAIKECNVLKSAVFRPCHKIVSAVPYYRSCLLDSCECRPRDRCYCESLTAYSRECSRAGKELDWRNATGCDGGRCSNGEQFMKCAPVCRRTCKKPKRDKSCRRQCRPGCYCPPGTVWHNRHCVPLDECPT